MAGGVKQLKPVRPRPGEPLYRTVKQALCAAIEAGGFAPGDQMPNTKELSIQLGVSLVTAHRALQEMVLAGILERSQGRGTFVHDRYFERKRFATAARVGLVFHPEVSLADHYHGQILDAVHRAAAQVGLELILLAFGEDVRNECAGYLLINPFPEEVVRLGNEFRRGQPVLVVGAHSRVPYLPSYDVNNVQAGRLAARHLADLGHERVGYVGAGRKLSHIAERCQGFTDACTQLQLNCRDVHRMKSASYRLNASETAALKKILTSRERPTAIFAAGYWLALDVYGAAAAVGLRIPADLSVICADDPASAAHLSPPMTTIRQPLNLLGREAVNALAEAIRDDEDIIESRRFDPELTIRRSTQRLGRIKSTNRTKRRKRVAAAG